MVRKIISGGGKGVERAALDAAIKNKLKTGGWYIRQHTQGMAQMSPSYELKELVNGDVNKQTELNLKESTGTIVVFDGRETKLTHELVELGKKFNKPCLPVDLQHEITDEKDIILIWLDANNIVQLNITGPDGPEQEELYRRTHKLFDKVFTECRIADEEDYND